MFWIGVSRVYHLLLAWIKLHLRKAPKTGDKAQQRFNTRKLNGPDARKKFPITPKNRYSVLSDKGDGAESNVVSTYLGYS